MLFDGDFDSLSLQRNIILSNLVQSFFLQNTTVNCFAIATNTLTKAVISHENRNSISIWRLRLIGNVLKIKLLYYGESFGNKVFAKQYDVDS